jgi:hypothetical protein
VAARKREITIRFVTAARQARISSIIDAISFEADDISITCKLAERPRRRRLARTATKNGMSVISTSTGGDHTHHDGEEGKPHQPQLVYRADGSHAHRRYIDVEASLTKLGLKREDLNSRRWPRGSPQHRLKRAVGAADRMN